MTRRLLNLLTALSLLVCVAASALCVVSYMRPGFGHRISTCDVEVSSGSLRVDNFREWFKGLLDQIMASNGLHDVDWVAPAPHTSVERVEYTVDLLAVAIVAAIMPVVQVCCNGRRRHQEHLGFCGAFGYDLRATPGRCPECGTAGNQRTCG